MKNKKLYYIFLLPIVASFLVLAGSAEIENNSSGIAKAQGISEMADKPLNCVQQPQIALPLGVTITLGPNELEINIGESADLVEEIAGTILDEADNILANSNSMVSAAYEEVTLASGCSSARCTTGCKHDTENKSCDASEAGINGCTCDPIIDPALPLNCHRVYSVCKTQACSGDACDFSQIAAKAQQIAASKDAIVASAKIIDSFFTTKDQRTIGCFWCSCVSTIPVVACNSNFCKTKPAFVLELLEKARSGNYLYCDALTPLDPLKWKVEPPGLEDCVTRPSDVQSFEEGEFTGRILLSCPEAIDTGLIQETRTEIGGYRGCYSHNEQDEYRANFSNYVCCE